MKQIFSGKFASKYAYRVLETLLETKSGQQVVLIKYNILSQLTSTLCPPDVFDTVLYNSVVKMLSEDDGVGNPISLEGTTLNKLSKVIANRRNQMF